MNRFRLALLAVVALIAVVVVVTVLRPPMPPALSGTASASVIPESERAAAPDFTGVDAWINSPPLSVAGLHGHVVLVDFWTFSCVNCVRTLPHLRQLYDAYRSRGFVVVGVHSPEFDFEKPVANVRAAVRRLDVTWPVAVDSEMATWNAYGNQYWPAEYLIDQQGRVAYFYFGEGAYAQTEAAVASLLGAPPMAGAVPTAVPQDITPELYAGSERGQLADGEGYGPQGVPVTYPDRGAPRQQDTILLAGTWTDEGQYLVAGANARVRLNFHADTVYVVAGTTRRALPVSVSLDGAAVPPRLAAAALHGSGFLVTRQDLYPLLAGVPPGYHAIDLAVPAGFQLYTFTFG